MAKTIANPTLSVTGVTGPGAWAYLGLSILSGARTAVSEHLSIKGPLVFVRKNEEDLEDISDGISALAALDPAFWGHPPQESVPQYACAVFGDDEMTRLASFERLQRGVRIVLATADSLALAAPAPDDFKRRRLKLTMGGNYSLTEIVEKLAALGYQRVDFVESPGEFAVRGAVVDLFCLEPLRAVRLLFSESKLESTRAFDPETQASGNFVDEVVLAPAETFAAPRGEYMRDGNRAAPAGKENDVAAWYARGAAGKEAHPLPAAGPRASVRDWLAGGFWIVEEGLKVDPPQGSMIVGSFLENAVDFGARPAPHFQGNIDLAVKQIQAWKQESRRVVFFSLNRGEHDRVQEILAPRLAGGACEYLVGSLRGGFLLAEPKTAVIGSPELFDRSYRPSSKWFRYGSGPRRRFHRADLKPGDYVVHQQYGVARYLGIRMIDTPERGKTDCMVLEYRSNDKLYVPMADFRMVQRYVAAEGHRPRLSSLDTRSWEDVKHKVKEGVRELAEELLKIQAERAAHAGFQFPPDSTIEREFSNSFPYEETPDQRRAIEEVKADMMARAPMDRLVVGDVGYGKTEVAMRAVLKCVSGMKQAAVLVPTTILAAQHHRTFSQRFAEYPVKVGVLSRFQTPKEQKETLAALKKGSIDIVVGTHRLLSPDMKFHDLGLLVIDEEHRFGVKHKEMLKALKKDVDVLSLSATPIPRTLNQALSGLRGISLIQSAPTGRQPIVTWVGRWSEERVKAAIEAELARGGQAYYVNNHVRNLPKKVKELEKLLPGARFSMVHGQMHSNEIEKVMWDFFNRKSDVLVASSIIESGLDISTVNTLLVEDAQDFGLAQLYQLRGRIGRERQKAYCYLFYPGTDEIETLPEEARKRLEALREFSELGSGMRLAMRDLEIRGAGDLLGARQHGFINAVGVEFYSQMLNDEVAAMKGEKKAEVPPAQLDLGVQAFIPESYFPGELERLGFYKRMLAAKIDDLPALQKELEDLSGPPPESVLNLFKVLELRHGATDAGVREVAQREGFIEIQFRADAKIPTQAVTGWMRRYGAQVRFTRSPDGDGVRLPMNESAPLAWLEEFLKGVRA